MQMKRVSRAGIIGGYRQSATAGRKMSRAFVKEFEDAPDEDDVPEAPPIPVGTRNYMTPSGYKRLKDELVNLLNVERPEVVNTVSWAASNGDRSENGDYIYGKKRLREIDRRIRFLTRRLDVAEVVDPAARGETDQIFFGATVDYETAGGERQTVTIVGIDEVDPAHRHVSWISPIARALLKARAGDTVQVHTPHGVEAIEIVDVRYDSSAG
jgi:transcription elongation factor GreB